jgi:hypothetical protein
LEIRLKEKIATDTAKAGQAIHAVVIAPVMIGELAAIPAGAEATGSVKEVEAAKPETKDRASLTLDFNELRIGDASIKIASKVTRVDNARETIDADGKIEGLVPSEMLTARIDQGINKLQQKLSGLASVLEAAKGVLAKDSDPNISYDAGVEMAIQLSKAIETKPSSLPKLAPFPAEQSLSALVNRQPFQTYAVKPPTKSDITNLMFIGSKEQLEAAFAAAGWTNAAALSDLSKFKTARAIVEQRGYSEAPVSVLILDDRPPDLVYEKGNNTFAARHHLRIWRSPDNFQGQPVWISSSTHDTGIDFSQQSMTFIHKIDSNIDAERAKVVNDFLFAGKVKSLELVPRPRVPQHAKNATGDNLDTDGAMAAMLLQ